MTEPGRRACPTCGRPWDAEAFYVNCSECKDCKRRRSQHNRAVQARKIAAFERFVEALVNLADRTVEPRTERQIGLTSEAA